MRAVPIHRATHTKASPKLLRCFSVPRAARITPVPYRRPALHSPKKYLDTALSFLLGRIMLGSPRSSSLPLLPTIPDFGQKPRWAVHWRGQSGAHCLQQYGVIHDANTYEESRAHHPNTKTPRREYKGTVSPSSCKNY